jgi:hypothetical protein
LGTTHAPRPSSGFREVLRVRPRERRSHPRVGPRRARCASPDGPTTRPDTRIMKITKHAYAGQLNRITHLRAQLVLHDRGSFLITCQTLARQTACVSPALAPNPQTIVSSCRLSTASRFGVTFGITFRRESNQLTFITQVQAHQVDSHSAQRSAILSIPLPTIDNMLDAFVLYAGADGLPPMAVGGIRKLFLPPALAYGAKGAGCTKDGSACVIPPEASLEFTIELLSIKGL